MKLPDINYRWFVVPFMPTLTILHVHWLAYLMDLPWPNPGAGLIAILTSTGTTLAACAWASGAFE